PPQQVDVVDQRGEQVAREDAALERYEVADRLANQAVLLAAEAGRRLVRDVRKPAQVVVADLIRLGGMEHGDLDRLKIGRRLNRRSAEGAGGGEGFLVAA